MQFVIIHGTGGDPTGNWFPWLKETLEERGHEVLIPDFPGIEDQSRASWMETFEEFQERLTDEPIFIAHSVGPAFVLNLLEQDVEAGACFFVAGFTGLLDNRFDEPNHTITARDFDFQAIRDSCGYFKMYHAPDDPYVPLTKAQELAEQLEAELEIIKDGGHLNEETGYTTFPRLRDDILAWTGDLPQNGRHDESEATVKDVDDTLDIVQIFTGEGFSFDCVVADMDGSNHPTVVNHRSDKAYYILEGSGTAHIGEQRFDVGPGDLITAASGTPHTIHGDLRYLVITSPPFDPADEDIVKL